MKFFVATILVALAANAIATLESNPEEGKQKMIDVRNLLNLIIEDARNERESANYYVKMAWKTVIDKLTSARKQVEDARRALVSEQVGKAKDSLANAKNDIGAAGNSASGGVRDKCNAAKNAIDNIISGEAPAETQPQTNQGPSETSNPPTTQSRLGSLIVSLSHLIDAAQDESKGATGYGLMAWDNIMNQVASGRQRGEEAKISLKSGRVAEGKDSLEHGNRAIGSARGSAAVASQNIKDGLDAASRTITEIKSSA